MSDKVHITADIPAELVSRVDDRVAQLGVSRSYAIRKGLSLFLRFYCQELTENVNCDDEDTLVLKGESAISNAA